MWQFYTLLTKHTVAIVVIIVADMVADMEMDKVAVIVADMEVDKVDKECSILARVLVTRGSINWAQTFSIWSLLPGLRIF